MNEALIKRIKFILVPLLLAAGIGFFTSITLRWLVDFKAQIAVSINVWYYYLSIGLALVLWWFYLRGRIKVLNIPNKNDNGYFFTHSFAVILLAGLFLTGQLWVETAYTGTEHLASSEEIIDHNPYVIYQVDSVHVYARLSIHGDQFSEVHGRRNNTLVYYAYFTLRMKGRSNAGDLIWLGKRYQTSLSNHASENRKNQVWQSFYRESFDDFSNAIVPRNVYLRRVPNNGDLNNYLKVIHRTAAYKKMDHVIYEWTMDQPKQMGGVLMKWLLALSSILLLFGILIPVGFKPNTRRLKQYEAKKTSTDNMEIRQILLLKTEMRATMLILYVNLAYMLYILIYDLGIFSPGADDLLMLGGLRANEFYAGEYWRLLTHIFIHAGLYHLVNNMVLLLLLGFVLEGVLKSWKFTLLYVFCGLVAGVVSMHYHAGSVGVGASGALFGLMGFMLGSVILHGRNALKWKEFGFIFFLGGISLLFGFLIPNVSNAAHIGGLITGVVVGLSVFLVRKVRK